MSHRFPPIASQYDLNRGRRTDRAQVIMLTLADLPASLPWFELVLGTVFLMALHIV